MVSISNTFSDVQNKKTGCTSRIRLGPVLFFNFINDLPLSNPNHNTDLFADDSTISVIGQNKSLISQKLNTVLQDIFRWCDDNKMAVNVSKTKAICIGSKQKLSVTSNENINLAINGQQIKESTYEKVLDCRGNSSNTQTRPQKKPLQASEDEDEDGTADLGCEPGPEFKHADLSLW
ncbi:unnamed protein product [Mytilus coruscus]|uniref:Uncharacterized protein n=1 Tax=Mytilus coruscus TaxID=42192 RepID=A0A6J8EQX5_MYTCO|nr:unnamed protein product [Mytilus coruscus]